MAKKADAYQGEAWERWNGESAQAYEAFSHYRDMGMERTTAKVGRELGKSRDLMNRWSAKWSWVERAREYDRHVEQLALKKATKEKAEVRARQIKLAAVVQKVSLDALLALADSGGLTDPKAIASLLKFSTELENKNSLAEETERKNTIKHIDEVNSQDIQTDTEIRLYLPDNGLLNGGTDD